MRAVYLSGPTVYLRALTEDDARSAVAWFDSPFPINASRAADYLRKEHRNPWTRQHRHLAIVRLADDEVVAGVRLTINLRSAQLHFHLPPWVADADGVQAEALGLLVPWLRGEMECLAVSTEVPADQTTTITAAEVAGMQANARLREHVARPGRRVDLLIFQATDPALEARDA